MMIATDPPSKIAGVGDVYVCHKGQDWVLFGSPARIGSIRVGAFSGDIREKWATVAAPDVNKCKALGEVIDMAEAKMRERK